MIVGQVNVVKESKAAEDFQITHYPHIMKHDKFGQKVKNDFKNFDLESIVRFATRVPYKAVDCNELKIMADDGDKFFLTYFGLEDDDMYKAVFS